MSAEKKEIFDRLIRNRSGGDDLDIIDSYFLDSEMEYEVKSIMFDQLSNEESFGNEKFNAPKNFHRIQDKIHKSQKKNSDSKVIKLLLKAGSVAAIFLIMFLVYDFTKNNSAQDVSFTAECPKGSINRVVLPDGTEVYLNADSEVKYIYNSQNKREVYLQGEARFKVTKDKKRKFVVHTKFYDVNVLGTEFNVSAYENNEEFVTTLEEGSISLTSNNKALKLKDVKLVPGQQFIYNSVTKQMGIQNVNPKLYSSWRDNKLVFINKDFLELVDLLERKYAVNIEVKDLSLKQYHYDGTIKNQSIFDMLDLIKITIPISYSYSNDTIIINRK